MGFTGFVRLYRKWFKIWGSLPVFAWVKAAALYRQGDFAHAAVYYEKGLLRHPTHPARHCARIDLAYCLFKLGRLDDAESHLKQVTKHLPYSREAALRLAQIQMWVGETGEAAWTLRNCLRYNPFEPELVASFLLAVLENNGPSYLLNEAVHATFALDASQMKLPKLEVARALLAITRGDVLTGRAVLVGVVTQPKAPLEAHLYLAELLKNEGRADLARQQLHHALAQEPNHPRVLAQLAEIYLEAGADYNPHYAQQLATSAAQNTAWQSPREMHTLAKAFYHLGDKMTALMIASQAKKVGADRGAYRDAKCLDELIASLSTGTIS